MMHGASMFCRWAPWLAGMALHGAALAQIPPATAPVATSTAAASTAAPATGAVPNPAAPSATPQAAPGATTGARFIESCNEALERGVAELGCQGPIYRNELERLKREALNTQNPQLLSFVGDAYQNPRSGLGDMGQAVALVDLDFDFTAADDAEQRGSHLFQVPAVRRIAEQGGTRDEERTARGQFAEGERGHGPGRIAEADHHAQQIGRAHV